MKKIIEVIFLIIIGLILIIAGNWYYQHKKAINICKDKCYYRSYENSVLMRGIGWYYREEFNKVFETQEQCIDYCLNIK